MADDNNQAFISEIGKEVERLRADNSKLRDAIRLAGFEVCQTSGDWTLHDVSEYGKAEEAKTLEVATRNVELEVENEQLRAEVSSLRPTGNSHVFDDYCECVRLLHEWSEGRPNLSDRVTAALADNAKLRSALETLMDEQNGPPLIRDAAHWHAAMSVGCDVVGRNVAANYHRMKSDELFAKEAAK